MFNEATLLSSFRHSLLFVRSVLLDYEPALYSILYVNPCSQEREKSQAFLLLRDWVHPSPLLSSIGEHVVFVILYKEKKD